MSHSDIGAPTTNEAMERNQALHREALARAVIEAAVHWAKWFIYEYDWADSILPAEERLVAAIDAYIESEAKP